MSDLNIHAGLAATKNGGQVSRSHSVSIPMTGSYIDSGIMLVGYSTEEQITTDDVTTYGYVLLKNLSSDGNDITIGTAANERGLKLKDGEIALFRCDNNAVYVKASPSDAKLEYIILED